MSIEKIWETATGKTLLLEERRWLKMAAEAVSARFDEVVIVNIGVYRFASMYCLRAGAPTAKVYGIDIRKPDVKQHADLRADVVIADSRTYWKKFNLPIHLLFIDGDHHYEAVKRDIEGWAPKVVQGGVVAFHDYAPTPYHLQLLPELEGVRRAVSEWQLSAEWETLNGAGSLAAFRHP